MVQIVVDQLNSVAASGSGTAALRLHEGLTIAGIESRLWIKRPKRGALPEIANLRPLDWPINPSQTQLRKWLDGLQMAWRKQANKWVLARALRGRRPGYEVFSSPQRDRSTPYDPRVFQGQILHLHWVIGFIDWASFFSTVPKHLPIVWTLHDMSPLTGGCHHADECDKFTTQCRNCPQLGRPSTRDLSAIGYGIKQVAYQHQQLHIVTPSRWLERHVRASSLMSDACSIQTIRNGLDLSTYRPLDKQESRQRLGLPTDRFIVGFGADSLKNPRKGIAELFEAFSRLPQLDRLCAVSLGRKTVDLAGDRKPLVIPMGYVTDPHKQALIYSAMDLFALPSWGENLPQMAVESMACATPVLAFDVGGIPEIVRHRETGLLAPLRDCQRFAEHLQWCLDNPQELQRLGECGRKHVEREHNLHSSVAAYQKLYERALSMKAEASRVSEAA